MKILKKIVCPIDFSPAANNAVEYASNLAQELDIEIELIHVEQISPIDAFNVEKVTENIQEIKNLLQKICDEIYSNFHVVCKYSVEVTLGRLEKIIKAKTLDHNLIIMGTNGIDTIYQYIFGTNTYHVIKKSKCPVLIIPENVIFTPIKKMVFAWDYSRENRISFLQLNDFVDLFSPEIVFLHISKNKSTVADDVYDAFQTELFSYFGEKNSITFARVYMDSSETIAQKIDQFVDITQADLLVITFYERGIFENIIHDSVTKWLSEEAKYPLLALHI